MASLGTEIRSYERADRTGDRIFRALQAPEIARQAIGPISQAICGGSERARKDDETHRFDASTTR
jgi:hypothetical protein